MPRVRIVIQARVGSTRFPDKIMAPLAGEPMLAHVVRRLQATGQYLPRGLEAMETMVATTVAADDDLTEQLCRSIGVACHRGAAEDVLARYLAAAADLDDDDIVIRATADNPVYCPQRTARILSVHRQAKAEYTCIRNLSYVVPEVPPLIAAGLGLSTLPLGV